MRAARTLAHIARQEWHLLSEYDVNSLGQWADELEELPALVATLFKGEDGISKLSQITNNLGDIYAGRFISPIADAATLDPEDSAFSGTVMSGEGVTIGSTTYSFADILNGTVNFGVVPGSGIVASLGTIGGWVIGSTSLMDAAGVVGMSSAVTGGDDIRFWAGHVTPASAPFYVTEAGALVATSATITGAITASSGTIGGWTISTNLSSGSMSLNGATPSLLMGAATDYAVGTGVFMGLSGGAYKLRIGNPSGQYFAWDGSNIGVSGSWMTPGGCTLALRPWTTNMVFSSTDADTVSWTAGTINIGGGTTYSIDAGNTGNMSALTYIYLDLGVSSTVLQTTTTYSTVIGSVKLLIASAQNQTTGASFIVFGGQQSKIDGSQIVAASILAGQLAADSVVASNIDVTNLAAINAAMGALTVDDKLTMSGASSAIAIGTTPPTSASAGTGLWIDRTGVYGLASNVQQAIFDAATGKITAGAGKVLLDSTGYGAIVSSSYADDRAYKFIDASNNVYGGLFSRFTGGVNTLADIVNPIAANESHKKSALQSPSGYACVYGIEMDVGGAGTRILQNYFVLAPVGTQSYQVFNESGDDIDFRVEGDADTNLFNLDAGLDAVAFGGAAVNGQKLTVYGKTEIDSGGLDVSDGNVRSHGETIADDAAISFTPSRASGSILMTSINDNTVWVLCGYNTATPSVTSMAIGSNTNVTTGALAGTTGTDGKLTVSAHTDGKIYVENRRGANRTPTIILI